jgi:ascorbate PTS system EIIA or EIIAB component
MKREILAKEAITLQVEAKDWEDAIRQAGELLLNIGKIESPYIEATIRNIRELGPYILIAPNIALPHARPEDGVIEEGISLLTLGHAVAFNEKMPFQIIICLAAVDHNLHIDILQKIAEILGNEKLVDRLLTTKSVEEVYNMFNGEVK